MDLGSRIKAARLELGLSQRQLCGDTITRNMLSQIENGSAKPSMTTLACLAERLGKPVSYFLEEQAVTSPNQALMKAARVALEQHRWEDLAKLLEGFQEPDECFTEEARLLRWLALMGMARTAVAQDRKPYAAALLRQAQAVTGIYITPELRRRERILMGLAGEPVCLPADEDALLLRAQAAESPQRCLQILGASEDREAPRWNLLQAGALFQMGRFSDAIPYFEKAPQTPRVLEQLEICCRELGDFRKAYEYACKRRENP